MEKEIKILITEDDEGHASLIRRNLQRAGIVNSMIHFRDGQEVMDFLETIRTERNLNGHSLLLLLDVRMPKMDGLEVLKKIKQDDFLKRIPVIMVTTTDDPREVELCHDLGCSSYVTKPVDYEKFVRVIRQLGLFLKVVSVPAIGGTA
jgi:CheY-like chemotaxis protein